MKKLCTTLGIIAGLFLGVPASVQAASVLFPYQGGTGTGSVPTYGQMLVGNAGGTYTLTATSSLGISSGTGSAFPFTPTSYGVSTTTTIGLLNGFFSTASSTLTDTLHAKDALYSSYVDASYFVATTSTATSTFQGIIAGNTTTGLFFDAASGRLAIGANDNTHTISGITYGEKISVHIEGATDGAGVTLHRHSDIVGFGSHLLFSRSRGTEASESAVVNGDFLGRLDFLGHDGTDYEVGAQIDAIADGVIGSNDMPTRLSFLTTPDGATIPVERMRITNGGNVGIGSTTPGSLLSIGGNGTGINFVDGTTATSTVSGNFHIKGNLQVDGKFFAPVTLVASGDTTINGALTVTGVTTLATSLTGVLLGTSGVVSNASVQTCTNQFVRAMSASYVATCATVGASDVSLANLTATDSTLTFSGTYTGATARTIGLNLGNANTWTALQQFANASSTQFSAGTNTFYVDSNGRIQAKDTTNNWSGVVSPTHGIIFSLATSTATWTATSTPGVDSSPEWAATYAGTIRAATCNPNTFLGVKITINGAVVTPSYFVASSTAGQEAITANNTFSRGDTIRVDYGTTTTATASSGVVRGGCSLLTTETP